MIHCVLTQPRAFLTVAGHSLRKEICLTLISIYLSIYLYIYVDYIDILDIEIDINIVDAHKNTPYT